MKIKSLGRGTFSKVILAEPLELSEHCQISLPELLAVKVVKLDAMDDVPADRITSSARRELDILKKISHPSISRLLAYKELPDKCLFGLQFSEGGDLFDFASKNHELLTPILIKRFFKELALAVQYLHETMHVVHRDLKLESSSPLKRSIVNNRRPPKLPFRPIGQPNQVSQSTHLVNRPRPFASLRSSIPSPLNTLWFNRLRRPRNNAGTTL